MAEHRLIIEQHIGRRLQRTEQIHHINCNKTDNRLENLHISRTVNEHLKSHRSFEKIIQGLMERNVIFFDTNKGEYKICKSH